MLVFIPGSKAYDVAFVLRCIGRISLPLFLFMTAEGMRKTRNKWKYLLRVTLIWLPIVIVEAGASIYLGSARMLPPQAMTEIVLFVLLGCFWSEKGWKKIFSVLPILYVVFSFLVDTSDPFGIADKLNYPFFLIADYDLYGLLMFVGFSVAYPLSDMISVKFAEQRGVELAEYKESLAGRKMFNNLSIIVLVIVNLIFWLIAYFFETGVLSEYLFQYHIQTYSVLAAIPLYFYNGKRGLNNKAFNIVSYLFYPVHMLMLIIIFGLLFWL